jgi:hypothetical protein
VRATTTGTAGHYVVSQLTPGEYKVSVTASGFRTQEQQPISVSISQTMDVNFRLEIGKVTETVEVSSGAALIQTQNPNTTTTVGATQLAELPNPGMDLSYVAQVAPGAIMNTAGNYGNIEFNGLPATSNSFTIDGLDANDPFLNLNNSRAINLQLGLNAVQEATVNTLSYSVDQGRQGAAPEGRKNFEKFLLHLPLRPCYDFLLSAGVRALPGWHNLEVDTKKAFG